METVPVLIVTGPVGAGKTSVASEISEILEEARVPHALVDIDALRGCYPRTTDDPYQVRLAMRNLAAVWRNFREEGAARLVAADVIESRDELEGYRQAVPGAQILVARLRAGPETLRERIAQREIGSGLDRHLRRAVELARQMERDRVEDFAVQTDGKPVGEVAREVLVRSGWLE